MTKRSHCQSHCPWCVLSHHPTRLSAASRGLYPNKYVWNPICFFSSLATHEVFPAGGFLCSLMWGCDKESASVEGILVLFARIRWILGLFVLRPGALGFFFSPHILIKRIILLMLCHRRTLWNESWFLLFLLVLESPRLCQPREIRWSLQSW